MGQEQSTLVGGGRGSHICKDVHNVKKCAVSGLATAIKKAKEDKRYYYIGYAAKENSYICNTLPKSAEWKKKFKKNNTVYADIGPSKGTVTEATLIAKHMGDGLCVNKQAGKPDKTGFVYVLIGQEA